MRSAMSRCFLPRLTRLILLWFRDRSARWICRTWADILAYRRLKAEWWCRILSDCLSAGQTRAVSSAQVLRIWGQREKNNQYLEGWFCVGTRAASGCGSRLPAQRVGGGGRGNDLGGFCDDQTVADCADARCGFLDLVSRLRSPLSRTDGRGSEGHAAKGCGSYPRLSSATSISRRSSARRST